MSNDHDDRRVLTELLDELESVRVGRTVRRRATAGLAVVALLAIIVALSLPGRTGPASVPIAVAPTPTPNSMVASPERRHVTIIEPGDALAHVEIATTAPWTVVVVDEPVVAYVEFMSDAELARALRERGSPTGIATYNGRTVLTSAPSEIRNGERVGPTSF